MNEENIVGEQVYYEKLYKIEGQPGKVFRYQDLDPNAFVFSNFPDGDSRYWIEDEPKLVRSL